MAFLVDLGSRAWSADRPQVLLFPQVPSGEGRWRDGLLTHPSSEPLDARYLVIQAPCPPLVQRNREGLLVCLLENM